MAKKYKCRVEYLESIGTQWIDTGVIQAGVGLKAELTLARTGNSTSEQAFVGRTAGNGYELYINNNVLGLWNSSGKYVSGIALTQNVTYNVVGDIYSTGISLTVDGSTYSWTGTPSDGNLPTTATVTLFFHNGQYYATGKIYYCKLWNNGVLVRDFIPVLDLSGKPAMYDKVSGQLFYNKGTGEFTYGRQIIPVEYLESTGTQYIDTEVAGGIGTEFCIDFSLNNTTSSEQIMGKSWLSSNQAISIGYAKNASTTQFLAQAGHTIILNGSLNTNRHKASIKINSASSATFIFDDVPVQSTINYGSGNAHLLLFARQGTNIDNYVSGKLYSSRIITDDTLVRDFIPAIDENNTPFMFDKVHNTVYLNAGTGQFKVGPNVEKVWSGKKLRRKLALALANLKKKRKYYCEVEYLESTGTQYIDTSITGNNNTKIDVLFSKKNTSATYINGIIGARGSSVNTNDIVIGINDAQIAIDFVNGGSGAYATYRYIVNNTLEDVKYRAIASKTERSLYQGNTLVGQNTTLSSQTINTTNLWMFGVQNYGFTESKIYYCKIYDDDVLVRDFIPVLDWNMTPCMYDRVTEQLFYNAGTGVFTVGREIHPVEYLEGTGTQYINTGLLSTASSTVDIAFSFISMEGGAVNNAGIFGGRNASTTTTFTFFKIASTTPQYFRFDYNGQATVGTASEMTWNTASKYRFQYNGTNCITTNTTTGESVVVARSPATTFTTNPICLFAVNTSGTIGNYLSGRIYYYKYSDGTNSVDMIPAIDENGVGFMFDRVSHTIYDNAGTGAFKYPAREVEYLEGTGTQYIDTGINANSNPKYELKFVISYTNPLSPSPQYIGADSGGTYGVVNGNWLWSNNVPVTANQFYEIDYINQNGSRGAYVNGTDYYQGNNYSATGYRCLLFAAGQNSSGTTKTNLFSAKMKSCSIALSNTIVRDFVPSYQDGVLGMWDKVNSVFYPNAGTGSFTTGKIVEPEYE